jgi:hypothetical protein
LLHWLTRFLTYFDATNATCAKLRKFLGHTKMLTDYELLAKVKELGDVSKSELVRNCGYVSTKKDGTERLNFTAFYEALLVAKGVNLGRDSNAKGGRRLRYTTKILFNGSLLVGKAYTALLGLEHGDKFHIKLDRRQITLIPADGMGKDSSEATMQDIEVRLDDEDKVATVANHG